MRPTTRIILTSGEPAGVGPDLCLAVTERKWPCELVIAGDRRILGDRARQLGKRLALHDYNANHEFDPNALNVAHLAAPNPAVPGKLDKGNARYVLDLLDYAVAGCRTGEFAAMITAPVQKSIINDCGIVFSGHTEYLADRTGAALPVMMLVAHTQQKSTLRVALATTHVPLSEVSRRISHESLVQIITILDHDLRNRFGIDAPRIVVCGLNPHAGESGHLGREEIDTIAPALTELRQQQHIDIVGPVPADTAFTPHMLAKADAVLAMYHDQGLPTLKYAGFGHAVNVTLGLPLIRTSVDHGTALDLAGTGKADAGSLLAAIEMAIELAESGRGTRDARRD